MEFKVGDIVKINDDRDLFYRGAIGEIDEVYDDNEVHVIFVAINEETGEEFIYEECDYYVNEIKLYNKEEN